MTDNTKLYDLGAINRLLSRAFTVPQLRRFCYERISFRSIVDEFSPNDSLAVMVYKVVEYCDKKVLLDKLLVEVRQENPKQYANFEKELRATGREPPSKPEETDDIERKIEEMVSHYRSREFQRKRIDREVEKLEIDNPEKVFAMIGRSTEHDMVAAIQLGKLVTSPTHAEHAFWALVELATKEGTSSLVRYRAAKSLDKGGWRSKTSEEDREIARRDLAGRVSRERNAQTKSKLEAALSRLR